MQACKWCRQSLIVPSEAAEARGPRDTALHDPPARQQHDAFLGRRPFHHCAVKAMPRGLLGRVLSRVAWVHTRHCAGFARDVLPLRRPLRDLGAGLFLRRRDMEGQHVAQGIHRQMPCTAACALRPSIAGSRAAFRAGWPRPALQARRRGPFLAPIGQPQEHTPSVNDGVAHPRLQPALGLRIHRLPWGQVMGPHPPRRARAIQRRP